MALSSSALIQAQNRVGEVDRIGKPPDGASEYRRGEPVSTVKIFRPGGSGEHGFAGFPLEVGDEISIERGLPEVYQVVIAYDDPTVKLLKLAPGDYVRLLDHDSIRADGGFLGWIVGKIRATTQYVQAIAPGTQYGIEVVGDRSRVFVWEGEVQVTNLGSNPQTVIVGEKQLTEAVGSNRPSAPRVPRFDEVRDLVLFGLEIDPVIRGTVTDETLRRRLHEDTIRAEFESRAQRSAVAPHINLGHVYLFLGKYNEALRAFELAEQVSPRPSAIYNGRGIALTMLGRFDAAAEAFGQAISRDDESMFHNNLANLYLRRGALDEALVEYERAIERDSKNAAPINGQGVVHFEQRDFPAAESAFRSSLKRANRAIPHSNLGNVFLLRGDVVSASREYDEAVTLDPQHAAAWNNRGVAHLKRRDFRAARR
ncbi:MAG: tetratricopeptide repeat protein, partial [Acidobacteria bacterium]